MKETAIEWLEDCFDRYGTLLKSDFIKAKKMEKTNIDNKVIHFAEWLTKRHTLELMKLYEYFEEQYYNETYKGK